MNPAVFFSLALAAVLFCQAECENVPVCPATSPDLNQCLRSVLQDLVPSLAGGIANIGAGPTDPLQSLPDIKYSRTTGLAPFSVHLGRPVITGLSSAIINDVQVDLASNTIRIQSTVPGDLLATGVHHTEGDIMGVPLRGNGPYRITLAGAGVDLTLQGRPAQGPGGQSYLQLDSARVTLQPGSASADIEGFFSSFPPLEQAAKSFTNSIAGQMVAELKPTLEKWLGEIALKRAQSVFSTVPYDTLFPGRTPSAFNQFKALYGYY